MLSETAASGNVFPHPHSPSNFGIGQYLEPSLGCQFMAKSRVSRYKVSHFDNLFAISFGSTLSSITVFGVLHLQLLTDLEHKVFFHNFSVETPD